MKYLQFSTAIKAIGGWTTDTAAAFITGYQINESRTFGQTTATKNVNVQTSFYKSLADKEAGESSFQPVSDMINPMGMGVYLSDVTGTITDTKVMQLTQAYYADKGMDSVITDDTAE